VLKIKVIGGENLPSMDLTWFDMLNLPHTCTCKLELFFLDDAQM